MVDVALVQLALTAGGSGQVRPIESASEGVKEAAAAGAGFVVLPELWRTGPFELEATLGAAEYIDGPMVSALSTLAAELGIWLHGGSFLERARRGREGPADSTQIYNTSLLFDPAGDLVASYRKRHLFGFDSGEAALIDAGDEVVVVDTPIGPTGLATCYDLRFPEHFRALMEAGAEAIIVSSGWPEVRISHWQVLCRARAIENQVNLLACNAAGVSGAVPLGGRSNVLDPWGDVLAEAGPQPTTLVAHIDPASPGRTRGEFPVLRDRRDVLGS